MEISGLKSIVGHMSSFRYQIAFPLPPTIEVVNKAGAIQSNQPLQTKVL